MQIPLNFQLHSKGQKHFGKVILRWAFIKDKRLLTIIVDAIFRTYSYHWSEIYVNENGANGLRAWLNTRNASGRKCAALISKEQTLAN